MTEIAYGLGWMLGYLFIGRFIAEFIYRDTPEKNRDFGDKSMIFVISIGWLLFPVGIIIAAVVAFVYYGPYTYLIKKPVSSLMRLLFK
jgi:phosphotransferase system  glucose/maltose/N-acetylglucosamine-specific IIC component